MLSILVLCWSQPSVAKIQDSAKMGSISVGEEQMRIPPVLPPVPRCLDSGGLRRKLTFINASQELQ